MIKVRRNLRLLPIFNFMNGFNLVYMILVLYTAELTGSYTKAMTILSLFSIFCSVLEIPTGMISDKIGRRYTIVVGTFCKLLSITSTAIAYYVTEYSFEVLILGSFFQAVGYSLYSGTDEALIYETMKELKSSKHFASFYGKIKSMNQLSMATAALLSGFLAHIYSYIFVIWLSLIPIAIAVILSFFIIEPRVKDKDQNTKANLNTVFKQFKKNKKLQYISISKIITEAFSVSLHRVEILYFEMLVSLPLIGIARFVKQVSGSISFWYSGKIISKLGNKKTLLFSQSSINILRLISLLFNNTITPFLSAFCNLFWGVKMTSFNHLSQNEFNSTQRATMGSAVSFFANILGSIVTIGIGYLSDITSPRFAILIGTIPTILVLMIYGKIFNKEEIKQAAD